MNVLGFCGFGLVALFWTCVLYSLYIFPIFLWMLLILVWPIISGLLCLKETLFTYILQLSTLGLAVLFLCEIEIIQKTHVNGTDMFGFTVIYACIIFGYYKYAKNLGLLSNTPMTSAEVEEKKKPQKEDKEEDDDEFSSLEAFAKKNPHLRPIVTLIAIIISIIFFLIPILKELRKIL